MIRWLLFTFNHTAPHKVVPFFRYSNTYKRPCNSRHTAQTSLLQLPQVFSSGFPRSHVMSKNIIKRVACPKVSHLIIYNI